MIAAAVDAVVNGLTEAQSEVLESLRGHGDRWLRPMDLGAGDGSRHSAVLAQLERKGLVESRQRSGLTGERGSKIYRLTPTGQRAGQRALETNRGGVSQ